MQVSDNIEYIDVSENSESVVNESDSGNEDNSDNQSGIVPDTTINFDTTEIIAVINTSNELQLRRLELEKFSLSIAIAVLICVIAYKFLSPFTKF